MFLFNFLDTTLRWSLNINWVSSVMWGLVDHRFTFQQTSRESFDFLDFVWKRCPVRKLHISNYYVAPYLEFKMSMVESFVHALHHSLWAIYIKRALRMKRGNQGLISIHIKRYE